MAEPRWLSTGFLLVVLFVLRSAFRNSFFQIIHARILPKNTEIKLDSTFECMFCLRLVNTFEPRLESAFRSKSSSRVYCVAVARLLLMYVGRSVDLLEKPQVKLGRLPFRITSTSGLLVRARLSSRLAPRPEVELETTLSRIYVTKVDRK